MVGKKNGVFCWFWLFKIKRLTSYVLNVCGWFPVDGVVAEVLPVGCRARAWITLGSTHVQLAPVSIKARTFCACGIGMAAAVSAACLAALTAK